MYDISVLANPLTWILLLTLIVSIVTQVSRKMILLPCSHSLVWLGSARLGSAMPGQQRTFCLSEILSWKVNRGMFLLHPVTIFVHLHRGWRQYVFGLSICLFHVSTVACLQSHDPDDALMSES